MRISDWSSDVCSSDLGNPARGECANEEDRAGHCTAVAKGKGHPPQAEPHQRETANIHRIAGDHRRHWQLQVFGMQRCFEGILCAFTQQPRGSTWRPDRKSVVEGTSLALRVELGGRRLIK